MMCDHTTAAGEEGSPAKEGGGDSQPPPFVGEWELSSFRIRDRDGNPVKDGSYLCGWEDSIGRIYYTPSGHVSAHLAKRERPKPSTPNVLHFTDADRVDAYNGVIAYAGTYEIDTGSRRVTHRVYTSTNPADTGTDLIRQYEFSDSGNTLSLSLTYEDDHRMILVWKRIVKA